MIHANDFAVYCLYKINTVIRKKSEKHMTWRKCFSASTICRVHPDYVNILFNAVVVAVYKPY